MEEVHLSQRLDIAIAGAGIGGLAAAALLARDGHRVEVFDQFERPAPVGSGLMLQETGLAVLAALGLRPAIDRLGARIDRLHGETPGGRTVLDVRYRAMRRGLHGLGVLRSALFDLLLRAALDAGARLNPGTQVAAADAVTGRLADGEGRALGAFDLVIDALGARSVLSSRPRCDLAYGALWATLPWPEAGPFDPAALQQRYRGARQMAGVMPSGRAAPGAPVMATYFWSILADRFDAWRSAPLADWKAEATALWPETADLIGPVSDHDAFAFARYRHRTARQPATGRLVHLGDSWHATSPQLGQGANMALLDAHALARALKRHGRELDAVRRAYLADRLWHVRLYQWTSFLFTPVYQSDSALLPLLRDWLMAPLIRVPPAPAILAALVSGAIGRPLRRQGLSSRPVPIREIAGEKPAQ